jgi:hypothetical protein
MNPNHQIIVRIGENFHCLSSPLSIRGHRADEVWIFGDLSKGWAEALAPLLAKVKPESVYYISALGNHCQQKLTI